MRPPSLAFWFRLIAAALLLSGCSRQEPPPDATPPAADAGRPTADAAAEAAAAPPGGIEEVSLASLPSTEGATPVIDAGHLVVPIPQNWKLAPRSSRWLVRIQMLEGEAYPSILVTSGTVPEGPDGAKMERLDGSNAESFAKALGDHLAKQRNPESIFQGPQAVRLGNRYGVYYAQHVSASDKKLDRLVVVTISAGRRYDVELRTIRTTLSRFRDHAFAVAAKLNVLTPEAE